MPALARLAPTTILPTVPSGAFRAEMLDAHQTALAAVSRAMAAMGAIYPQERDYIRGGRAAYAQARDAHQRRLLRLKLVHDELREIVEHVG